MSKHFVTSFFLLLLVLTSSVYANDPYIGSLKIYMVEPESRYYDDSSNAYENGFLGYATYVDINVEYGSTWEATYNWDSQTAGFDYVTEDNIRAISVLFDDEYTLGDANPPNNYWFIAYLSEAAAGAIPGGFGQNKRDGSFTHTVFIEELTATW